jgi:hypothetical protein
MSTMLPLVLVKQVANICFVKIFEAAGENLSLNKNDAMSIMN